MFRALERSWCGRSGRRCGAGGGVCSPRARVVCGVFDPIRVSLECVDQMCRDVPDLIVLAHVAQVSRSHYNAHEGSVRVVFAKGRLWVDVVGPADVVSWHDVFEERSKKTGRVAEGSVRDHEEACGPRFK